MNESTAQTENGALTLSTSGDPCVDFFALEGALRGAEASRVLELFAAAYASDAELALRLLFYGRDRLEGLGERSTFRNALVWLAENHPLTAAANLEYIPEFGRFDDWLCLLDTPLRPQVLQLIAAQLKRDESALQEGKKVSLLGKWLPSINASCGHTVDYAYMIADSLNMKASQYRRLLSKLRRAIDIVETHLCQKKYDFSYSEVPSLAFNRYFRTFIERDSERFNAFLDDVRAGKAKVNTAVLLPCDITYQISQLPVWMKDGDLMVSNRDRIAEVKEQIKALDTLWQNLPQCPCIGNSLVVADVSASMMSGCTQIRPLDVSVSLGIYFAEHNTGVWHNRFMTFSAEPEWAEVRGEHIVEKYWRCATAAWGNNTDIKKVFELVLQTALDNDVAPSDLVNCIYIISDMEFDDCTQNASVTNFEYAKALYERHGYKLPNLVFWNVNSKSRNLPVRHNESGVALVSGYTPKIFSNIFDVADQTPADIMRATAAQERYNCLRIVD